jgi:hypothetical protein
VDKPKSYNRVCILLCPHSFFPLLAQSFRVCSLDEKLLHGKKLLRLLLISEKTKPKIFEFHIIEKARPPSRPTDRVASK